MRTASFAALTVALAASTSAAQQVTPDGSTVTPQQAPIASQQSQAVSQSFLIAASSSTAWSPAKGTPQTDGSSYGYSDCVSENSLGLTNGGEIAWFQGFDSGAGDTIVEVSPANGSTTGTGAPAGNVGGVYVYDDPAGDFIDPTDLTGADLVESASWTTCCPSTDTKEDVALSGAGVDNGFWAAASMTQGPGEFPAAFDSSTPSGGRTWVAGSNTAFDPTNPGGGIGFFEMSALGFDSVWLIGADGGGGGGCLLDNGSVPNGSGRTVAGTNISGGWSVFQSFDVPDADGWCVTGLGIDGWEVLDPAGTDMNVVIYPDDGTGTAADLSCPINLSRHGFTTCSTCSNLTCEDHAAWLPGGGARYWAVTRATDQLDHWSAIYAGTSGGPSYSIRTSDGARFDSGATALKIKGTIGGAPSTYCTAKQNLVCGVPAIGASGTPRAGKADGFKIFAGPARSNRSGLILYSCSGAAAIPFQGGLLCVAPTVRRVPPVNSGGSATCSGQFSTDFNEFASGNGGGNPDPCLKISGQEVWAQYWGRDSIATGSFLSDAINFKM